MTKETKRNNILRNIWQLEKKKEKLQEQIEIYYQDLERLELPAEKTQRVEPSPEELEKINQQFQARLSNLKF